MTKKLVHFSLFILLLILLQQGIALNTQSVAGLSEFTQTVRQQDIDPSVMFYMESEIALKAEKDIRMILEKK